MKSNHFTSKRRKCFLLISISWKLGHSVNSCKKLKYHDRKDQYNRQIFCNMDTMIKNFKKIPFLNLEGCHLPLFRQKCTCLLQRNLLQFGTFFFELINLVLTITLSCGRYIWKYSRNPACSQRCQPAATNSGFQKRVRCEIICKHRDTISRILSYI